MRNFFGLFLMAVLAQSFMPAAQAESLSLQQAQRLAEEKNPDLKALRAQSEKVSWEKTETRAGFLPHLSIGFDHFFQASYLRENVLFGGAAVSFPAAFPQNNLAVDASWTIFDGFDSYYRNRASDLHAEAADLELHRAEFALQQKVRISFYQALAAQKLFVVAQENIKSLEEHLSRAKLSARAGYGMQFDVLRIEATLEEARADLEQANNNVQLSGEALFEIMGVPYDQARTLAGDLPDLKETMIPQDVDVNPNERKDVQALIKKQEAMSALKSAGNNFWYPSISLFAEQQYYQFGNFDPVVVANSGYENASFVGVRLKWNLFDGGVSYAHEQQALQSEIIAESQTEKAKLSMHKDVDGWKRKFKYGVSLYKARLRALAEFQESVRLAEIGVKAGSRTHSEMLDAELDLFRARGGVVKAQTEAIEALGQLELAVGRQLWISKDSI